MKSTLRLFLVGLVAFAAKADMLKLRDGRMFTGQFLGATKTEIWFQRDPPSDILATQAFPIAQIESLIFGPDVRQSSTQRIYSCKPIFSPAMLLIPGGFRARIPFGWLGGRDSNPDTQIQSLQSYH